MDIHECIATRRSIRVYREEAVPAASLEKVLAAIQWAPSWVNLQPWEVVVVDDRAMMAKLAECVPDTNPGKKALGMAPVVLAVCGRQGKSGFYANKPATAHGDWVMFDLGIACQNACLAAWAQGLGSLHLGLFNHEAAGQVLALPDDVKVYELIPLGVPAKEGKAPPRKDLKEFVHHNRFGQPRA